MKYLHLCCIIREVALAAQYLREINLPLPNPCFMQLWALFMRTSQVVCNRPCRCIAGALGAPEVCGLPDMHSLEVPSHH